MKKLVWFSLMLTMWFFLVWCTAPTDSAQIPTQEIEAEIADTSLSIVTTFPPLYAHVANIVDDNDTLTNLVPPGTSIHTRQPRPSDVLAMESADIIITNWLGLEEFLDWYLDGLEDQGVTIVDTSKWVITMDFDEHDEHDDHDEEWHNDHDEEWHDDHDEEWHDDHDEEWHDDHDEEWHDDHDEEWHDDHDEEWHDDHDEEWHDDHVHVWHHHEGTDPHIRLDPKNAKIQVWNIVSAMVSADTSQRAFYESQSDIYMQKLDTMHNSMVELIEGQEINPFIVFHDAYQYFLKRYDLSDVQVWLVQSLEGDNPSQKQISDLIEVIQSNNVSIIYTEPQFNPSIIKNLEQETWVKSREIDPIWSELTKEWYINTLTKLSEAFIQ